jgi:hypothetical protein
MLQEDQRNITLTEVTVGVLDSVLGRDSLC